MNQSQRLLESTDSVLRYGSVSAILKIHDGHIVDVTHTETQGMRGRQGMWEIAVIHPNA